MADEDGLLPVGLALEGENDDDTRVNAAALFGIDLGDGSAAPIDVDADGGEGRRRLRTPTALLLWLLVQVTLVSANRLCGLILRRSMRLLMVLEFAPRLFVRCANLPCLLDLLLALVT